jgi:hypothetical protein
MDLQSVKFVNIFRKDDKGKNEVAIIPISSPQKIRAYIDSGDLQPENAKNNDHGWRLDPSITAQIRDILDDPFKLEEIAKQTTTPLDMLNAFRVFMYEVSRNRALARRATVNSLDKELATSEYEQEVAKARQERAAMDGGEDDDDEETPEHGRRNNRRTANGA